MWLLFLLAGLQTARAQYVEIEFDILSQSGLKTMQPSQENKVSGSQEINNLQWIGITVSENIELKVTAQYRLLTEGDSALTASYLNNGTSNLGQALLFKDNKALFMVSNSGRLIKNIPGRPVNLTAWIGLPTAQISEVTIEYN